MTAEGNDYYYYYIQMTNFRVVLLMQFLFGGNLGHLSVDVFSCKLLFQ